MVETAVHRRLDDIILPQWKEQIEEAKLIYRNRKGVMNKVTLNKIKKPLHEDTLRFLERYIPKKDYDDLLKKSTEALLILNKYEKLLLSEQDSPTIICDVPSTIAEWDALKAKATAERKAKRNSGVNVSVRH
jgi:hypothetical protein